MKQFLLIIIFLFCTPVYSVEYYASVGYQNHDANWNTSNTAFDNQDSTDSGYHFGFAIRNNVGQNKTHFIGAGMDIHEILGERVLGYRAIDYQYKINEKWRVGGFFGAASIDTGLPQNGYYMGASGHYFFKPFFSVAIEIKHGNGLARDRLLLDDPDNEINRPDIFLDYVSTGLLLNWHF